MLTAEGMAAKRDFDDFVQSCVLGITKYRVGKLGDPHQKTANEKILYTLIKKGTLSSDELIKKHPEYGCCIETLLANEIKAGHIREEKENGTASYTVTGKGKEYMKFVQKEHLN